MLNAGAKVHKIFETSKYKVLNQRNFSLFMQNSPEWKKENGRKKATVRDNQLAIERTQRIYSLCC